MQEDHNHEGEEVTFDKARDRLKKAHKRLDKAEERMAKNVSGEERATETEASTDDGG
jgi:exonuclease VII small subunit